MNIRITEGTSAKQGYKCVSMQKSGWYRDGENEGIESENEGRWDRNVNSLEGVVVLVHAGESGLRSLVLLRLFVV